MRLSLIPITHVRFFFQLYEIDDNPARREFLDELFAFMQKRGESQIRIIVTLSLSPSPLQQELVWVSRLGWPRTKISQTQFFSESISKLIIWRAGETWSCLGWGTNEKKSRANRRSIILQRSAISIYRPPLCSPMMSYADNEPGGRHNASLTCVCFSHSTRCAPQHHLSSSAGTNNTHEAIFRSHRSFRSLAELWVISSQSP